MKRDTVLMCCAALLLSLATTPRLHAQAGAAGSVSPTRRMQIDAGMKGGIMTLYALDPLAHTFCFADGGNGLVFQDGEVRNRCSDVDFGNYKADSFSVGIEGGRVGAIVDLGGASDLARRYGYEETVGGGQGFASLRAESGRAYILKDRKSRAVQELRESALLFRAGESGASAPVRLGNLYLIRLTDRHDKTFERLIKMQVITHTPNQSATIRWQVL